MVLLRYGYDYNYNFFFFYFEYFILRILFVFMKKWRKLKHLKIHGYDLVGNIEVQNLPLYKCKLLHVKQHLYLKTLMSFYLV